MPWVRLDDHFDENAKIASVGPLGLALWVTALAYCNRNLTDGFIPWSKAHSLVSWEYLDKGSSGADPLRRIAQTYGDEKGEEQVVAFAVKSDDVILLLIDAGLWDLAPGGYQVHDFDQFQPLKADVEAVREVRAEAGRRGGLAKAKQSASNEPSKDAGKSEANLYPVPDPVPNSVSDPDPVPKPEPLQRRFSPNPSTVRTRLWSVFSDLTGKLTPPPYEEDQFELWESKGCTEQSIEETLRETGLAKPTKPWPYFKARLGERLVTMPDASDSRTHTVRIVR